MKKILVLVVLCLLLNATFSQSIRERVHISGGSELWPNFVKEMFLYPHFKEGVVEYKNKQRFQRKLNYNKVLEAIQFIDEKNDTLVLANESAVNYIAIGSDVFVYKDVCLQDLTPEKNTKLYRHQKVRIADIRRRGALGIPNSTSAIESLNQIYTWMNSYEIDVNELLLLSKETDYYIPDAKGNMISASRKNIVNRYPDKETEIREYIDSKNIRFTKEPDLLELISYISSINKAGK